MKICFFGIGGVGGYFGALVADRFKNEHEIYFIARGNHKSAVQANGLTLRRAVSKVPIHVSPKICTDTVDDLPVCDLIILSVKGYDLTQASSEISKIVDERTIIVPLLNGVDIYQRMRENLSMGIILPSCVYIIAQIESPGVIYQKGGSCKIIIGSDHEFPDDRIELLLALFREAVINIEWKENIKISIWTKYIFIAAYGLVTAAYDKTFGQVLDDLELGKTTKAIMAEIGQIAKKLNIILSPDIIETSIITAQQFPYESTTSFQRDIVSKGKPNEGDLFGGTIIRYGEKLKVPTPNTSKVYERLLKRGG